MTCKFFFGHKWGKWEKIDEGRLGDGLCKECEDNTIPVGVYMKLERECSDCGYRQIKVIKYKF